MEINWSSSVVATAFSDSRWSEDACEVSIYVYLFHMYEVAIHNHAPTLKDPRNVLVDSPNSWWSSRFGQEKVILDIDLGADRNVRLISIFWGDDGGRIRPHSKSFLVMYRKGTETSEDARKRRERICSNDQEKKSNGNNWNLLADISDTEINYCRYGSHIVPETCSFLALDDHTLVRHISIVLLKRQPYYNNHAISRVCAWGPASPAMSGQCPPISLSVKYTDKPSASVPGDPNHFQSNCHSGNQRYPNMRIVFFVDNIQFPAERIYRTHLFYSPDSRVIDNLGILQSLNTVLRILGLDTYSAAATKEPNLLLRISSSYKRSSSTSSIFLYFLCVHVLCYMLPSPVARHLLITSVSTYDHRCICG